MKFGIIREEKYPPDARVALTPSACAGLAKTFPHAHFVVQSSAIRAFSDEEYTKVGIEVVDSVHDCDVLIGVKEVPINALVPNKTYLFFSHTIKAQPYNQKLLQTIRDLNIHLIDWECLIDRKGNRLLGFGRYAGIVGAYNGILAWGKRFGSFDLKPAQKCHDQAEMNAGLSKVKLPSMKIVLTGVGRVVGGAEESLTAAGVKKVSAEAFLDNEFSYPVYCKIGVEDYYKNADGSSIIPQDFYLNPAGTVSDFMKFAKVADMFIAGHFYGEGSPYIFTRTDAKSPDFNLKVVADISCDIDGPVASTIRPSTIEDPIYGYNPSTESEDDFRKEEVITVMAVDNLPCELPRDASEGFSKDVAEKIIPAFFDGDNYGILERGTIINEDGLNQRFSYLHDYLEGK